jgi:pimeloyl-ACP methyl ester carboxylesterase
MNLPIKTSAWKRHANFMRKAALVGALALAPQYGKAQTTAAQPPDIHNIILVHGAWADGSSWDKVIPLLEDKGFHVTAVHLPFTTLAEDAATVERALALEDGPVLLVGHSYGGAVITEAGDDPKVAGLVYVAAFAPDQRQSVIGQNSQFPPTPGDTQFRPDASGFIMLTYQGVAEDFAQDLTPQEKHLIFATQGQVSGPNEIEAPLTTAAWRRKPDFYIVADQDRMIDPELEEQIAEQMNATTIHISSSHVPMLSHPAQVANFIVAAARE